MAAGRERENLSSPYRIGYLRRRTTHLPETETNCIDETVSSAQRGGVLDQPSMNNLRPRTGLAMMFCSSERQEGDEGGTYGSITVRQDRCSSSFVKLQPLHHSLDALGERLLVWWVVVSWFEEGHGDVGLEEDQDRSIAERAMGAEVGHESCVYSRQCMND